MRFTHRRATVLVFGVAMSALLTAPASSAEAELNYVALGDSSAAGPLVPDPDPTIACLRSTSNYPAVVADLLGAELTDVTCSGAKTEDLSGRQFGFLPPQLDALGETTDLVTLSIGANDIGLFEASLSCINALPEPMGVSCEDRYTEGGADQLAEAVEEYRAEFAAALDEIRARAPHAELLVTGYGTYIQPGGCHPDQPVWGRDADYLQGSVNGLSSMIAEETAEHDARFVDFAAVTEGHDICAAPEDRYYEGVLPAAPAAPLHPNAAGMAAFGKVIAESSRQS